MERKEELKKKNSEGNAASVVGAIQPTMDLEDFFINYNIFSPFVGSLRSFWVVDSFVFILIYCMFVLYCCYLVYCNLHL